MRKIVCQCCEVEGARWVLWDSTLVCETCRLAAIDYLRNVVGLSLARPHVFLDELSQVDSVKIFTIRA